MQSGFATSPSPDSPPPVSAFDSNSASYDVDNVSAGDDDEEAATTSSSVWREESEESLRAVTQSSVAVSETDSEPVADVQSDLAAESYSLVSSEALGRV